MEIDVLAVLQQYAGDTGIRSMQKVEQDYAQMAQRLPVEEMTVGLSQAFRSESTPSFVETVSLSYERGNAEQRVNMFIRLIDGVRPITLRPLQDAGMLQQPAMTCEAGHVMVDLSKAEQFSSELIERVVHQVEREDDQAIDKMSGYYAENPHMAKTLGGPMLGIVLEKLAETR